MYLIHQSKDRLLDWNKKQDPTIFCAQGAYLMTKVAGYKSNTQKSVAF
jgi:hypothetical protein